MAELMSNYSTHCGPSPTGKDGSGRVPLDTEAVG